MGKHMTPMQNVICIISIILGAALILYYLLLKIFYQYVAFSMYLGAAGILLLLFGFLQKHYQIFIYAQLHRFWQIVISVILTVCLLIFAVTEGLILYYGHTRSHEKTDVILVLGAGLNGREISSTLKYRLDAALKAHHEQPGIPIIVSGGQGSREAITEAKAMADYLLQHGVPASLIIKEDNSSNTFENFQFSKKLFSENAKVLVITNNFHMMRAMYIAKKAGLDAYRYPSPAHFPTSFNFHIREFFGLAKDILFH